ncbi:MAG: hypothetical protein JNK70_09440, partial [Phycisphaerae bacterium]|nr:hypothetical protein [Phycisphaerae bacterium]
MNGSPSPNGLNGVPDGSRSDRDGRGRFAAGNRGGPGNPLAPQVAKLRAAMIGAVSPKDMRAITDKLVELARAGNVAAIKEVFERTLGKPQEADL